MKPPRAAAEGLAQGGGGDIDAFHHPALFRRAAATGANEAGRVRVVDHDQGIVLPGQGRDVGQPGHVAVHAEHAVGRNQPGARAGGGLELRLEVVHVAVAVAQACRLAQADTVNDGGVVELVADDGVLLAQQRFEQARVGIEAGGVEDGVVGVQEIGERPLQLLVQVLRAADEAHRGHAEAVGPERVDRCLHQLGMVGETEVIVGAEVQYFAGLAGRDLDALRRGDDALALVQTLLLDRLQFGQESTGRFCHSRGLSATS